MTKKNENIIKKIIKESLEDESNKNDWDWINDVNPFITGNFFSEEDVCFNSNNDCKVNINDNNIIFVLDYDEWKDFSNLNDENDMYLAPLLIYGPNHDGDGDYYEFDSEEFNYSGYHINNEQRSEFQKILDITSPGSSFADFLDEEMNNLDEVLKYKPLIELYKTLRNDYLDIIGYSVQKNRWLEMGGEFSRITEKINTSFKLRNDEITITVSMEEIFKLYDRKIMSLSDILKNISSYISGESWYDNFYQSWDTSGGENEINDVFNEFLEKANEILENADELKPYKDFIDLIEPLGFKRSYRNSYETKTDTIKWVIDDIDYYQKKLLLKLYRHEGSFWSDPIKQYKIPFDELPTYINNIKIGY